MSGKAVMAALLAFLWLGPLVAADAANAEETLAELIRSHPECRQFNDGCSICKIENGTTSCSAPSIACIRTGWTCADTGAATTPQGGAPLAKSASVALTGAIGRLAARPRP
jgi:hypothetical protein